MNQHAGPRSPGEIQAWLIAQIARQLELAAESIDAQRPFFDYGLTSREAVVLSGELSDWLGERCSPTLAYDYPSIEALARHLARDASSAGEPVTSTRVAGAVGEPIAVIGIGCRFPGAPDPDAYWDLLDRGLDGLRACPPGPPPVSAPERTTAAAGATD